MVLTQSECDRPMKTDKHNQLLSEIGALRDKVEEALRHADERTHAAEQG